MEQTTLYIEIPVKIDFYVEPGQKETRTDPGYPAEIGGINFSDEQVIEAVNHAIFGKESTINEDLWEAMLWKPRKTSRKKQGQAGKIGR